MFLPPAHGAGGYILYKSGRFVQKLLTTFPDSAIIVIVFYDKSVRDGRNFAARGQRKGA